MIVPAGWITDSAKPGPFTPKAAYRLPKVKGDAADCIVRITHFPGMKGMDAANIDRWVRQVQRPDGSPSTRDDARISVADKGSIRLTIVDLTGKVTNDRAGSGFAAVPNHRMIAAILDHPQGPHFAKITGEIASMEKWQASIFAFLDSATVN